MEKQTEKDEVICPSLHGQEKNSPLCCLFKTFPGLLWGADFLPPLIWTGDYSLGPTPAQSGCTGWGAAAAHGCFSGRFSRSWWEQPHGVRLPVLCCVLWPKSPFLCSNWHHLINMRTPLSSSPPSRSRFLFATSLGCSGRTLVLVCRGRALVIPLYISVSKEGWIFTLLDGMQFYFFHSFLLSVVPSCRPEHLRWTYSGPCKQMDGLGLPLAPATAVVGPCSQASYVEGQYLILPPLWHGDNNLKLSGNG